MANLMLPRQDSNVINRYYLLIDISIAALKCCVRFKNSIKIVAKVCKN